VVVIILTTRNRVSPHLVTIAILGGLPSVLLLCGRFTSPAIQTA